jgi:hypothetical protein
VIALEEPPGFVVRTEAQKAAWDNGYRLERGVEGGWLQYASTTVPGAVQSSKLLLQGGASVANNALGIF